MGLALAMAGLVLAVSALYLTVQLRQSRQQARVILRQLEVKTLASDKIRIFYIAQSFQIGGAGRRIKQSQRVPIYPIASRGAKSPDHRVRIERGLCPTPDAAFRIE